MRRILALGLLLASFSAQAVQYQVQQLQSLSTGGPGTIAYGQNESGQIVGQSYNSATGVSEAVVWDNGVVQSLGFQGIARAVNNNGIVVGETGIAVLQVPTGRAFKWDSTNGYNDLGDLAGGGAGIYAGAYDINENNVITGFSFTGNSPAGGQPVQGSHGFRYENGSMTDLGQVAATGNGYSRGHGINDAGEIAGRGSLGEFTSSDKHMLRWDAANNSTSVAASGSSIYSTAQQINNNGQIVGNGINNSSQYLGMIWDSSNNFLHWLDPLGGTTSRAWSINDDGTIVGYGSDAANKNRALISYDGGATSLDLNLMIQDLTGWQFLSEAYDINENGQIVGYGILDNGERAAFVATVVPLPAAVWMFLSALGAMAGFRKINT